MWGKAGESLKVGKSKAKCEPMKVTGVSGKRFF